MGTVLLVDHSGRGHAIADLFSRSSSDVCVHYAPGCGAITTDRVVSHQELSLSDPLAMVEFARRERIDLVFVANTMALASGYVDVFRRHGLPVVGPDRRASRLETSKVDTKQLCSRYAIPVAEYETFEDPSIALDYVRTRSDPVVVKADGLCGGNGTFVCDSAEEAEHAVQRIMVEGAFGEAGKRIVVEKRLFGTEFSFFALSDGIHSQLLPLALDYPKSDDGNTGVTCGGVGAISPHPLGLERICEKVRAEILGPLMRCVREEGLHYKGFLYLGCMLADERVYLLEINVRMGDPEAEVILPRIESDFLTTCSEVLAGKLPESPPQLNDLTFCDVVASQGRTRQISSRGRNKGWYVGWPYGRFGRHYPIRGLEKVDPSQCRVFHGETTLHPRKGLVSDGARVLHVVGFGPTIEAAADNAYRNLGQIGFNGMRYRSDIGRVMPWELVDAPCLESAQGG